MEYTVHKYKNCNGANDKRITYRTRLYNECNTHVEKLQMVFKCLLWKSFIEYEHIMAEKKRLAKRQNNKTLAVRG